jgi:hypothetical protein
MTRLRLALFRSIRLATAGLVLLGSGVRSTIAGDTAAEAVEFFEKSVRPILVERCGECHGPSGKAKGGLRLTSREAVLKGGDSGPAAVEGRPEDSLIVAAVRYVDEPRMPPSKKLADAEIDALTRWIKRGLPWPEASASRVEKDTRPPFVITEEQRRFWSFQPVREQTPREVRDASWPRSGIDHFILAPLESRGLRPAAEADRRVYIRRATFDLTGLPPTPEEVEAFVNDPSPDPHAALVDRLLASPRYGERWGRHWLDLVRYTDSFDARIAGTNNEMDCNDAWRYRDWVVAALNRDLPYDEFVTHQVAGDLVPGLEPGEPDLEATVATGLLALGNWGGGDADKEKLLTDIADDQVDVVSRAFLGLTVACARCHDHKFDPISTRDYYGLAGIFFSTHILPNVGPKTNGPPMLRIPLLSHAEQEARDRRAKRLRGLERQLASTLDQSRTELARSLRPETARYILAAFDRARGTAEPEEGPALLDYALRQWAEALGLSAGEVLLSKTLENVHGKPGVFGWRGEADTPSALLNANDEPAKLLTFTVPARGVTVHPGPKSGVGVVWTSPLSGEVRVSGEVGDTDPAGGDGVAWSLDLVGSGRTVNVARGELANGASAPIRPDGGPEPRPLTVAVGDRLRLTVLPRSSHTCDTTRVHLSIAGPEPTSTWDLADDLLHGPPAPNPHGDRHGRAGVWGLVEVLPAPPDLGGSTWKALTALVADPESTRAAVEEAALAFQASFDRADAASPFWAKSAAAESALPGPVREAVAALREEIDAIRAVPEPPPDFTNGAQEGGVPGSPHEGVHDVRVHIRGSYSRLGDLVPRHFPVVLAGESQPTINSGSGRLELARWLTSPDNPLTARVIVNRVWQHHFGAGLVRTPSNFGKLGEPPTHPELLDHLAREFVRDGWSIKRLHRRIVLSSTYRQSSEGDPATLKADPDNRLFGRMNRRRLDAESLRDALLSVSGRLDLRTGGPAVRDANSRRRALYLMTIRSDRTGFGPLFDAADPTAMVEARNVSTVAPQALYLLNNSFVLEQSAALARRLVAERLDESTRLDRAYALLFGRRPSGEEREVAREGLATFGRAGESESWPAYAHVLLCTNEWVYVD